MTWKPPLPPRPGTISLAEQVAELKRELALRENVYPKFVADSRKTGVAADREYLRMQAALHSLLKLQTDSA